MGELVCGCVYVFFQIMFVVVLQQFGEVLVIYIVLVVCVGILVQCISFVFGYVDVGFVQCVKIDLGFGIVVFGMVLDGGDYWVW